MIFTLSVKGNIMATINITESEQMLFKDLKDGNTVQFRVAVSPGEESQYGKGQTVTIVCGDDESTGKIVSDPLVVSPSREGGKETIALVVEKA
jgi:hypothetical protein